MYDDDLPDWVGRLFGIIILTGAALVTISMLHSQKEVKMTKDDLAQLVQKCLVKTGIPENVAEQMIENDLESSARTAGFYLWLNNVKEDIDTVVLRTTLIYYERDKKFNYSEEDEQISSFN